MAQTSVEAGALIEKLTARSLLSGTSWEELRNLYSDIMSEKSA